MVIKRFVLLFSIFIGLFFVCIWPCFAHDYFSYNGTQDKKRAELMCQYSDDKGTVLEVYMYYYYSGLYDYNGEDITRHHESWNIFAKTSTNTDFKSLVHNELNGSFKEIFSYIFYDGKKSLTSSSFPYEGDIEHGSIINGFYCTDYVFFNLEEVDDYLSADLASDYGLRDEEKYVPNMCFGDTSLSVGTTSNYKCDDFIYDTKLKLKSNGYFGIIKNTAISTLDNMDLEDYYDLMSNEKPSGDGSILREFVRKSTWQAMEQRIGANFIDEPDEIQDKTMVATPTILKTYFYNDVVTSSEYKNAYNNFKNRMKSDVAEAAEWGIIEQGIAQKMLDELSLDISLIFPNNPDNSGGSNTNPDVPKPGDGSCKSLLGDLTPVVENLFKTIQYGGPVLVAVLTIVDFIKASLSDDASLMKKATKNLYKRVIAAALLFFIPVLVSFLFSISGITYSSECLNI